MNFSGSFPKPARIGVGFNPQLCLYLRSMVAEREIYLVNENTYVYQSPLLAITILVSLARTAAAVSSCIMYTVRDQSLQCMDNDV